MTDTNGAVAKVDPAKYNDLVSHATIRDIRLIGSKFDSKPEAMEVAERVWTFNIADELEDWNCDNEKGRLTGIFSYTASCLDGRRKLISVNCRFLCTYNLSNLCDEEAGRVFLTRVGRFAAYPYFRTVFAVLTQQSGIMLPPLPVISDGPRWVNSPKDVENRKLAKTPKPASAPRKKAAKKVD